MRKLLLIALLLLSVAGFAQLSTEDSLRNIISINKNNIETARAYNLLAIKITRTDLFQAKELCLKAAAIGNSIQHPRTLSTAYSNLVSMYQNLGMADSALFYLEALKNVSGNASGPDMDVIIGNYNSTAGLFYRKSGNVKEALPYFKKSIQYAEKSNNKVSIAGQSLNLANTFLNLSDYEEALIYYFKALQRFEELNNKEGQSYCLQGISNSFSELKQFDKAIKYVNQSIAFKTELKDERGLCTANMGLGEIYSGLKQYDKAISYFTIALSAARNLKLVTEERDILFNLGRIHADKKNITLAKKYLLESKMLAHKLEDKAGVSAAELQLIALKENDILKDTFEVKVAANIGTLKEMGNSYQELSGYQQLANYYEQSGDYKKALESSKKYHVLRDSIQGNELKLLIGKMEEQYNANKKEKEISILKKDGLLAEAEIREQKSFQIAMGITFGLLLIIGLLMINRYKVLSRAKREVELEKMRNNIARDLHDDIGSTLSSINIMSNVMLSKADGVQNTQDLQKIKDHSKNMMESMSDIVWAISPHNDSFEKLVYRMKEFASEILEPINIQYDFKIEGDINTLKLDPGKRKNLFLIFKESLNNAAKYSNCSFMSILFKSNKAGLQMQVTDNGSGFDEKNVLKGNGIRNMKERASEMNATLTYRSDNTPGTIVDMIIPIT